MQGNKKEVVNKISGLWNRKVIKAFHIYSLKS
jgi:hypothetical protein